MIHTPDLGSLAPALGDTAQDEPFPVVEDVISGDFEGQHNLGEHDEVEDWYHPFVEDTKKNPPFVCGSKLVHSETSTPLLHLVHPQDRPILPLPILPKPPLKTDASSREYMCNTSLLSFAGHIAGTAVAPPSPNTTATSTPLTVVSLSVPHDNTSPAEGGATTIATKSSTPPYIVSFEQSEVRQNAFFFIVSRGGLVLEQPGNKRLRRIINMFAPQYVETNRPSRGVLKHQVFDLCRGQFEFVIQKQAFLRSHGTNAVDAGRRQLSKARIDSILQANGGLDSILSCKDTDFIRVGEDCALDVVGHLLRDAANQVRRAKRSSITTTKPAVVPDVSMSSSTSTAI